MNAASLIQEIDLGLLSADPYPTYAALRELAPVAWIPALNMYWVTRYNDVRSVLLDTDHFTTGTSASLIFDIFGEHMLTTEGRTHKRYRNAKLNGAFMPASLRNTYQDKIERRIGQLLGTIMGDGQIELRTTLASRLPVLSMIDIFGLTDDWEPKFRGWYDAFEAALSNHSNDPKIRIRAKTCAQEFHADFQTEIDARKANRRPGLLHDFLDDRAEGRLTDEEIRRNALIILFGGISTVEAVILNSLWALLTHPQALSLVLEDNSLLDATFHETVRWLAPVQSATRHAVRDVVIAGIEIPAGATVNCMLGSANRDAAVFKHPEDYDISRRNARDHLGFATGPHHCLGRHLAQLQMRLALDFLLTNTKNLRLVSAGHGPRGHEFRQPASLCVKWDR